MALVGQGDDELLWEPYNPDMYMTEIEDNVFAKDITLYQGTTICFKLVGNGAWDAGYNLGGYDVIYMDTNSPAELAEGNDSMDLYYTATRDCILTVKLNMNGNAPTVTLKETSTALPPLPGTTYVKLYVSIPEGITPNIWAWGDNGDAFSQWPGEPMIKNGDWWEIEIPDDCCYAIVNDGAVQTCDLDIAMGAKNWIVVNDNWSATVYNYEPDPTTYIDVYVRMANGITPYLWAYDSVGGQIVYEAWPGSPMTWDGEWWYLQVPSWADCLLVNDGSEEYLTTQNLYLSDCEQVWIDVDADWYGTVYDTEPKEIDTYTVYVRVPKSWGEPYLDSGDECYTLTSDGQWWRRDLPVDVDKFLITNGYSESPSVSLSIEDAIWIDVMDNGLVHVAYENPGEREDLEPEKPKIPPAKRIKPSTDNTSEESSSGWIILLVAGILVVAAAATVIIVIVVKRKKKQNVVSGDASPTNTLNYMEEK